MTRVRDIVVFVFVAALALAAPASAQSHVSKPFAGAKVNGGTVTHTVQNGKHVLTLSDDFKVPDTPDPHWQVVDSKGRVYLLQRLGVKNGLGLIGADKVNRSIVLPAYVGDIAKVQIYCSWAEAVLGETTFSGNLMTMAR
ncbi:MAG TPA: hypothetical protein VK886_20155 [Vicinamibacterales bacterium]|nr:hypothetical protein [Vicinamibacterales bacterium]